MGEGGHEIEGRDAAGDGGGDDSGVTTWLQIFIAAICADGRISPDFPNRAGTRHVRAARCIAIGLSNCKSSSSATGTMVVEY